MLLRKKILLILLLTEVISIPHRQQPKYSNNRHMPWNYT
ncbi:rCG61259 [Rattus norvegicus]|uniref:RCG61259 n=1 Tax=Rattus norvegicus TaxID=10116 RepID=A6KDY8_RAT|nr:rCG61259 [Rattus norvegicus]